MAVDGDTLAQPDLASVLASVRTSGPGDFYSGPLSARFLAGVREAGGSLSREDLANYQPVWRKPLMVGFDDKRAYFASPPPAGGVIAGQMWAMLVEDDRFNRASPADREVLLVSAAERAFADRQRWVTGGVDLQSLVSSARVAVLLGDTNGGAPTRAVTDRQPAIENPAAATFVAIDGQGAAVACAVTLNSLFGAGRVAGDTGIVLASAPGQGGRGAAMLGPMVAIKPSGRELVFAAAAAGGVAAPTALVDVASRVLLAGEPLGAASEAPRMHGGSDPDVVYVEPGASTRSARALINLGYEVVSAERLGGVSAIACPAGLQSSPETCAAATDPRGFGLAVSTE